MIRNNSVEKASFPNDFISPDKKDRAWRLATAKAIWSEWNSLAVNSFNRGMDARTKNGANNDCLYDGIAAYMEGRQNSAQYLPMMGVKPGSTQNWMQIDITILPIMPMLVRIVTGILDKSKYDIGFRPNDPAATDRKNRYFAELKARLKLREQITAKYGPQAPQIIQQLGLDKTSEEPGDMEELEMQALYTYKDIVATEWSSACKSVLSANRGDEIRKQNRFNTLYYGVAGTRDYLDTNGALKCRAVDIRRAIVSWCEKRDFSDMRYAGERITMSMQEFAQSNQEMSATDFLEMAKGLCGKFGNPESCGSWDEGRSFKMDVLDVEWKSIHLYNYEVSEKNKYGNMSVVRQPANKYGNNFVRKRFEVWYRAKWVIGTEIIWDDGLCTDLKRAKGQLQNVEPNFHFYAPMMTDMRIQSIGQAVIPICDQLQWAWLKLQKTVGEYRSKGLQIDFAGTEGVKLGKGGKDLDPPGVVELILQGNMYAWRSKDVHSPGANIQKQPPVMVMEGTGMDDILNWMNAIQTYVQMLKSMILGLNEYTDASTPDARSLGATVNTAVMATNNSLNDIVETDIHLLGRLSESIVIRLQDMVQFGLTDRLAMAIGDNSVQFFKDNPAISPADWNIEIRPLPTEQERQRVLEDAKAYVGAGMLEYEDVVVLETTQDLQEARHILGYKLKKRKEQKIQESLALQEQNGKVQSQSAIDIEKERQVTVKMQVDGSVEVAKIQAEATKYVADKNAEASMAGKALTVAEAMDKKEAMAEAA